jgi:hypothetical protein
MPSPSPEALRDFALTALDAAHNLRWASHNMNFIGLRPEPQMPEALAQQRKMMFLLCHKLLEKEFAEQMDKLCSCWTEFREATK